MTGGKLAAQVFVCNAERHWAIVESLGVCCWMLTHGHQITRKVSIHYLGMDDLQPNASVGVERAERPFRRNGY